MAHIKPGWIYLLKGQGNQYKIGMTTRVPTKRLLEFVPKLPFETQLIFAIPDPDPIAMEMVYHEEFAHKRIRGEWFELTQEDVDLITSADNGIWVVRK
jgi:hypothetical protein